jgi:carboxyl-terminal processing protease
MLRTYSLALVCLTTLPVIAQNATPATADLMEQAEAAYQAKHFSESAGLYPPELIEGTISRLPLRTRLIDGHLLVIGSRDPAANLQGLHAGDEIVTINSEPAISWAQRNVAPFVSASTSQDRNTRTYEYVPFLAPIGTTFALGIQTPSGKQTTHVFEVTKSTSQHIPLFDLKFLPGNIAYVAPI